MVPLQQGVVVVELLRRGCSAPPGEFDEEQHHLVAAALQRRAGDEVHDLRTAAADVGERLLVEESDLGEVQASRDIGRRA